MDQKQKTARRFDRWARSYESDRRSRFNAVPQREALRALALQPDDRFLDVGCGTGAAVRAAAEIAERAVGLDLSPQMIERAKNLAADARAAEFVVGDSEQLPFADEGFTALLCTASLHHYPKPERALAEIARVLAPGGRFVLADGTADRAVARVADRFLRLVDSSHVRLYRTDELVAMLAGAGLETTDVRHLWDGGFAIIASRKTSGG